MKVVVEQAAALVVDASYITASASSAEAFKTATLLKTLNVNSLITGEIGVGKKSLAQYILPDAAVIDAANFDELLTTLQSVNQVIITNLENSPNINKILNFVNENNIREASAEEAMTGIPAENKQEDDGCCGTGGGTGCGC